MRTKPKTRGAINQAARTERMKRDGFKMLRNFWIYPEHEERIKKYAARLIAEKDQS